MTNISREFPYSFNLFLLFYSRRSLLIKLKGRSHVDYTLGGRDMKVVMISCNPISYITLGTC